jgi:hypothetical protein
MCVIYVCNTKLPPDDELKRGASINDDGAGLSWLAQDPDEPKQLVVQWQKGLKDDEAVKKFIKEHQIPFPLIIHFRTASVGGTLPCLTHPFPTIQDVPLWEAGFASEVLFHNGHLSNWDDLILAVGLPTTERFPEGPWSDTRALAWLTYLKGPGILDFVIKSSRVALMHADPATLEGEEYDKSEDHITLYGSGWTHNDGFSQSIVTATKTTVYAGGYDRSVYSGAYGMDRDDEEEAWREGFGGKVVEAKPVEVKALAGSSTSCELNVWTIEELNSLIASIDEEQSSAKLAAGV